MDTSYKHHDIKDTDSERQKCNFSAKSFVEELVMRVEIAFPDNNVMACFSVLSPKDKPHMVENLNTLTKRFPHT